MPEEDFEPNPFNKQGELGRFYQLFKEDYEKILEEINEVLAAYGCACCVWFSESVLSK